MKTCYRLKHIIICLIAALLPALAAAADDLELYTYKLTESTTTYQLWTAPPSHRVFKDESIPTESGEFSICSGNGNQAVSTA